MQRIQTASKKCGTKKEKSLQCLLLKYQVRAH